MTRAGWLWFLIFAGIFVGSNNFLFSQDLLSADERAWLSRHPVIRVAPDPGFYPVEFFDQAGKYQGLAADFLHSIGQKLGIRFEVVHLNSWNEVISKIRNKEVDLLGNAVETAPRREFLLFTQPYLKFPSVILCQENVDADLDMNALKGMKVSAVKGYAYEEIIRGHYPEILLDLVPDISSGIRKVSLKISDAFIGDLATTSYYLEKERIRNLKVCGEASPMNISSFAVRKDWPQLAGILEKGLLLMTLEEKKAIYRKWITLDLEPANISSRTLRFFLMGAGALAGLFLLFLVWNFSLKRKVRLHTADLRQSEEELREILDLAPVPIGVSNPEGKILLLNEKFQKVIGYFPEEIPNVAVWEDKAYPDQEYRKKLDQKWTQSIEKSFLLKDKNPFPMEAKIFCKDGKMRDFQILTRVSSRRVIVIFNDLSEQKEIQDFLIRAKEKAEEASRAKSLFLSNMSHEIRTPLNGIMGMTDLLFESSLNPDQREYLQMLKFSAENLLSLMNGILELAKMEGDSEKPEKIKFDFKNFIREILALFQRQSEHRKIPLIYEENTSIPPFLSGDPSKLRQILLNLLSNAFKFTREGKVSFSVFLIEENSSTVRLRFCVEDTGIGISSHKGQEIFEPFVQGDLSFSKSYQGTGVGLSVALRLARILGANLSFESEESKGTRFFLELDLEKI